MCSSNLFTCLENPHCRCAGEAEEEGSPRKRARLRPATHQAEAAPGVRPRPESAGSTGSPLEGPGVTVGSQLRPAAQSEAAADLLPRPESADSSGSSVEIIGAGSGHAAGTGADGTPTSLPRAAPPAGLEGRASPAALQPRGSNPGIRVPAERGASAGAPGAPDELPGPGAAEDATPTSSHCRSRGPPQGPGEGPAGSGAAEGFAGGERKECAGGEGSGLGSSAGAAPGSPAASSVGSAGGAGAQPQSTPASPAERELGSGLAQGCAASPADVCGGIAGDRQGLGSQASTDALPHPAALPSDDPAPLTVGSDGARAAEDLAGSAPQSTAADAHSANSSSRGAGTDGAGWQPGGRDQIARVLEGAAPELAELLGAGVGGCAQGAQGSERVETLTARDNLSSEGMPQGGGRRPAGLEARSATRDQMLRELLQVTRGGDEGGAKGGDV